jgi:hypothetical protein
MALIEFSLKSNDQKKTADWGARIPTHYKFETAAIQLQ